MAIEITRLDSGRSLFKRYVLRVTPPHADQPWESPEPMSRRAGEKQLYEFGNHTADIAEAFAAADDAWNAERARDKGEP